MLMVLKFGGSSLADMTRIRTAAERAAALQQKGHQVVAVVSAQADTTDALLRYAHTCNPHPSRRELDAYLSAGEQMSAALFAMTLELLDCRSVSLTGQQAGLLTDGVHGNARVLKLRNDRIMRELAAGKIVVVAGFQGVDALGDVTTLGRGGSDTTAVALTAYLHGDECMIYTDVDGVYDRDPRKFKDAVRYERISYEQMLLLARQGAQVLHDRCVELAQQYGVPVRVLSSFRPGEGTLVADTP